MPVLLPGVQWLCAEVSRLEPQKFASDPFPAEALCASLRPERALIIRKTMLKNAEKQVSRKFKWQTLCNILSPVVIFL